MSKIIEVKAVEMTPEVMQGLEDRGFIIRLAPSREVAPAERGETADTLLYRSDPGQGPHQLIAVSVNMPVLGHFGAHTDSEEFLLIGDPATKPMYILVALCGHAELKHKIVAGTVGAGDFIALRAKFNDADVSFFTMLKGVPHGEVSADGDGKPASFFVTEPAEMETDCTNFGDYLVKVVE